MMHSFLKPLRQKKYISFTASSPPCPSSLLLHILTACFELLLFFSMPRSARPRLPLPHYPSSSAPTTAFVSLPTGCYKYLVRVSPHPSPPIPPLAVLFPACPGYPNTVACVCRGDGMLKEKYSNAYPLAPFSDTTLYTQKLSLLRWMAIAFSATVIVCLFLHSISNTTRGDCWCLLAHR